MASIRHLFALFLLFLLLPLVFAQPPTVDGADSEFLEPVRPPPPASQPSPSPGRSVAPAPAAALPPRPSPPPFGPPPLLPNFCRRQKFRMLSGQCTSAVISTWGEIQRTQFSYLRGHSSTIPSGQGLKSAREISNILSDQKVDIPNGKKLNDLFVFFGQFIDHNVVATPADGEEFPIIVPPGDPKFSAGTRLSFKRSSRGFTGELSNERPINTLSSALDLSAVYGVNDPRNNFLLEKDSSGELTGKMKTSPGNLLPFNTGGFNNAPNSNSNRFYLTGDHRANEHPVLTSLHTIFVREHNHLVDLIKSSFPQRRLRRIGTRTIYMWARQLNIAQFQKIVYEEFLPAILGRKLRYRGYRRFVDPTVSDIFAGAAYRVGHTMVSNVVSRRGPSGPLPPFTMAEVFFRERGLQDPEEVDNLMRGAANTRAQEVDLKVHDVLRNMLFDSVQGEEGFDLVALNIQRGRDHALPTFNQIRGIFRLPRAATFSQISSNPSVAMALSKAYNGDVDAVEAWPGLVAENKASGAGLGKTMVKVWEVEFQRLSEGDQFFYLRRKKSISRQLQFFLKSTVTPIFSKNKKLFREIIIRNTGVTSAQLPSGDIFKS